MPLFVERGREGVDDSGGLDRDEGEPAQVADQVEGFVGPVNPAVGVVGDARGLVELDPQAVDGPVERCAARHRVLVRFVGDADEFAAVVDLEGRPVGLLAVAGPAHLLFYAVGGGLRGAFVFSAVHEADQRVLRAGLVADVQVHERSSRRTERLEVIGEGNSRQVALQVVAVAFTPVGCVHHPVEVFPDVVLGDVVSIAGVELLQAPVGDVVVVAAGLFGQVEVYLDLVARHFEIELGRTVHGVRVRVAVRPAGSSAWRSGIVRVARVAKTVRLLGDAIMNASVAVLGWDGPRRAGRSSSWSTKLRTGVADPSSSGPPPRDGPGLSACGAEIEEPVGRDGSERELLSEVDENRDHRGGGGGVIASVVGLLGFVSIRLSVPGRASCLW